MDERYMVPPKFKYSQKVWKGFTIKGFIYFMLGVYPSVLVLKSEGLSFTLRLLICVPLVGLALFVARYERYDQGLDVLAYNWACFALSPKRYALFRRDAKDRTPSTKRLVPVRSVEGGVLSLEGGAHARVLRASSLNYSLFSEKEMMLTENGFRRLCHSLSPEFPLQFFIRSRRVTAGELADSVESTFAGPGYREARGQYVRFLRSLCEKGDNHRKEFYVVVPYSRSLSAGMPSTPGELVSAAKDMFKKGGEEDRLEEAGEQLAVREKHVRTYLARCGVEAEALEEGDIVQLLYEIFNPDLAGDDARREDLRPYLEEGECDVADTVAPRSLAFGPDYVRLDNLYLRIFCVMDWPTTLWPGWMQVLNDLSEDTFISIHVSPRNMAREIPYISRQYRFMHGSDMADRISGMAKDHMTQVKMEKTESLMRRFAAGEEKLFDLACLVAVKAGSLEELAERSRSVKSKLAARELTVDVPRHLMREAFASLIPTASPRLPFARAFTSSLAGASFPMTSADMSAGGGVLYGVSEETGSVCMVDRFRLRNHNAVIVGSSGAGKSFFGKALISRELARGVQCVVLDPEGEYRGMCEALGGAHIVFAPDSDHSINPLDRRFRLAASSITGTDALVRENMLFLKLLAADAKLEYAPIRAERLLYETYARKDEPLLADLRAVAAEMGYEELANSLFPWTEGTLKGLFDRPTNVDLASPLIVFDISRVGQEHRGLAIQVIGAWFWKRIRDDRVRRIFQVDEASWLLQDEECASYFEQIARRGRKYGVGFTIIDQQFDRLFSNKKSRAIVSNCALLALFSMEKGIVEKYLAEAVNLSPRERELMMTLATGECILHAGPQKARIKVEASEAERRLFSTSLDEGEEAA